MSAVSVSGTASVAEVAHWDVAALALLEPTFGHEHSDRLHRVQRDTLRPGDDGPGRRIRQVWDKARAEAPASRRPAADPATGARSRACPRPMSGRRSSSSGRASVTT